MFRESLHDRELLVTRAYGETGRTRQMVLADKLRPHVAAIQMAASGGDAKAQQIVSLYKMHCACPNDPGAPALCEATFDDWMKERTARLEKLLA